MTVLPTIGADPTFEEKLQQLIENILMGKKRLSYSSFSKFMQSPDLFVQYCLAEKKTTRAMTLGNLFHTLVLEPQHFDRDYIVDDVGGLGSKAQYDFAKALQAGTDKVEAWKEFYSTKGKSEDKMAQEAEKLANQVDPWIKFQARVNKRKIVSPDLVTLAKQIAESVRNNRAAKPFVDAPGDCEMKVEWTYQDLEWIGYMDKVCHEPIEGTGLTLPPIIDLKKTVNASYHKVRRNLDFEGWDIQAAAYSIAGSMASGGDPDFWRRPYLILAADEDLQVSLTHVSKVTINRGMRKLNRCISRFKECLLSGQIRESYEFYAPNDEGIYFY